MKKFTFILAAALTSLASFAQEEKKSTPLEISGSVDTYFKYDFAKNENIATSFATDQNSLSLGMIDVVLKKTMGKTSFVGELSFGPRGQNQSIPTDGLSFASNTSSDNGMSFNIQNLYVSYAATDKLTLTAGYLSKVLHDSNLNCCLFFVDS